jgi:hypothetical protein
VDADDGEEDRDGENRGHSPDWGGATFSLSERTARKGTALAERTAREDTVLAERTARKGTVLAERTAREDSPVQSSSAT